MDLLRRPRLICEFIGAQVPPPAPGTETVARKRAKQRRRDERSIAGAAQRAALAGVSGREEEDLVAGARGAGKGGAAGSESGDHDRPDGGSDDREGENVDEFDDEDEDSEEDDEEEDDAVLGLSPEDV